MWRSGSDSDDAAWRIRFLFCRGLLGLEVLQQPGVGRTTSVSLQENLAPVRTDVYKSGGPLVLRREISQPLRLATLRGDAV